MILILFLGFLGLATMLALTDWRRGWPLMILVGVLQDPVRKLTPGQPIVVTFCVLAVVGATILAAHTQIMVDLRDFSSRFGRVSRAAMIVVMMLFIAGVNGILTFGLSAWKAPALSFALYTVPVAAVLFGYTWLRREESLFKLLRFYAIVTSIALFGVLFEYLRFDVPGLGLVASSGDYIRHLPGLQIRMLSGFYRAPDIMGWHAAMLASIGIAMAIRVGVSIHVWPWLLATGWGFFHCLISGRRKAVYFVIAFAALMVWRYVKRLQATQVAVIILSIVTMLLVVQKLGSSESTSAYTRGAATTEGELFSRLEGGLFETVRQFGIMGAGLGSATQGVRHFLGTSIDVGWQEGGLGKLAVEVGIPGVLTVAVLGWTLLRLFLAITRPGDVPGSSQHLRVTLFAIVGANGANFMASAQAYSDPVLALLTAFFIGCLFAAATLDERLAEEQGAQVPSAQQLAPATVPVTA